ncbi:MAG: hypothetical protein WCX65_07420 [bacterium]
MPENIHCPFCNFETPYPVYGKIMECLGECYTTYSIFKNEDDPNRARIKLVEIFFLDSEYNIRVNVNEIDEKCEFKKLPANTSDSYILFARERRVEDHEIEKLKSASGIEIELGVDILERVHSALDRYERDIKDPNAPREKLLNDIKVVEKLVRGIRERIELSL